MLLLPTKFSTFFRVNNSCIYIKSVEEKLISLAGRATHFFCLLKKKLIILIVIVYQAGRLVKGVDLSLLESTFQWIKCNVKKGFFTIYKGFSKVKHLSAFTCISQRDFQHHQTYVIKV